MTAPDAFERDVEPGPQAGALSAGQELDVMFSLAKALQDNDDLRARVAELERELEMAIGLGGAAVRGGADYMGQCEKLKARVAELEAQVEAMKVPK